MLQCLDCSRAVPFRGIATAPERARLESHIIFETDFLTVPRNDILRQRAFYRYIYCIQPLYRLYNQQRVLDLFVFIANKVCP